MRDIDWSRESGCYFIVSYLYLDIEVFVVLVRSLFDVVVVVVFVFV